jgi:DNA-directed RNA polymerase specialized sigma54-like protein
MMAPRDELERYEATEAQNLTRLLRALRPPERAVQVPPPVDLTIRAEIWKAQVRRQVIALLSMARRDLIQVIRQALTDNPMLEEVAPAEDEHASAGEEHVPHLTAAADDLTDAEERYDSIWQACVPDGWDAHDLPSQASEAPSASERPSGSPEALVPDVIVMKVGHDDPVFLNEEGMPRLRLSATSRHWVREGHGGEPEATQYLDDKLRAAVWLIRSLEHRRQTILKVATSLVKFQRDFLDHGLAYLKPLVLKDVAEDIGMHESTVSRVTTSKYMSTEQGIFELKYFFHSGIELYGGETMSSLTVKDRIKNLVAAEDPGKPLTDQQLVEVLAAENVKIARRTVTKYRRELKLPPANRRHQQRGSAALGAGPVAGASRLSPDEEQRVRQALFRRWQAEPPLQHGREEASGVPPESEEPRRRRDDEAAESLHQWVEKISGEVRAARRDLQTALAHPQLRPAVLLALRAFAQAAQAGATTPPPADAVEPVPRLQERPLVEALSSIHDLDHLIRLAIERTIALLDIESVSIILLDEARQELYVKVAVDPRAGHEQRLRGVRFPATHGIAGWVIREGHSLIVPDVDHDPRFYRGFDVQTRTQTRSLVCVPLGTQERTIGVLNAMNKRHGVFTAEDVRRLETFAHQLAHALEHARVIQERYNCDVQLLIAEAEHLDHSQTSSRFP